MARNENRRRKKLEAKRRKSNQKKREVARRKSTGIREIFAKSAAWPVITSRITKDHRVSGGMLSAVLARQAPDGQVAAAVFLTDTSCLGVKDVIPFSGTEVAWKEFIGRLEEKQNLTNAEPAYLCKLILECVDWAKSSGLPAHSDYYRTSAILNGIDPADCDVEMTFGQDGKPHYISGPYDSPAFQKRVAETLNRTVGPGNFHVTTMIGGDLGPGLLHGTLGGFDLVADELYEDDVDCDFDESETFLLESE